MEKNNDAECHQHEALTSKAQSLTGRPVCAYVTTTVLCSSDKEDLIVPKYLCVTRYCRCRPVVSLERSQMIYSRRDFSSNET